MRRILYVGFKGEHNSSFQLVKRFSGEKLLLTNSFGGLAQNIDVLTGHYDSIYMFGLDKNLRNGVRIERYAEQGGHCIETTFRISELASHFDSSGISYAISDNPTHYLCNAAYYRMLCKMNCPVVFIHIPPVRFMSEHLQDQLLEIPKELL